MNAAVRSNFGWFVGWALVGGIYALGVLTLLTIGPFLLPVAVVATVVLVKFAPRNSTPWGLLSGIGLPLLYIGYLNRGGPGTVCHTTATEQTCVDEATPWPFLAAGLLLVACGVVLYLVGSSRRQRAELRR